MIARIGRTALLEELENAFLPESQAGKAREAIADRIYSYSADEAEEYFALFYERDGLINFSKLNLSGLYSPPLAAG